MALDQTSLDDLWDFSDPTASEARLRAASDAERDPSTRAELDTQVARALGLQGRFADGHAVLDAIVSDAPVVQVRIDLERGRLHRSASDPGDSRTAADYFRAAAAGATSAGLGFLQVDALHMLALTEPDRAEHWTAEAVAALDTIDDARTQRWRVSLHNNAGWAHLDAGRPTEALASFEASRQVAERWGTAQQVAWADEAIAEARLAVTPPGPA
ncbi:MAG: hypothetical protein L6311_05855 [Cellulomonas sp.]|nr:hypothetical protein [Cellulomonas sp.]